MLPLVLPVWYSKDSDSGGGKSKDGDGCGSGKIHGQGDEQSGGYRGPNDEGRIDREGKGTEKRQKIR